MADLEMMLQNAKEEIKACVLIHVIVWQKPLQYCKVIFFQLK